MVRGLFIRAHNGAPLRTAVVVLMGEWRKDQSKNARRYVWGQTRGEHDSVRRDFITRVKGNPQFANLRVEKIGPELHLWRLLKEDGGKEYWTPCLRFVDDEWGYWTVWYRADERRWRATGIKEVPIAGAIEQTAQMFDSLWDN